MFSSFGGNNLWAEKLALLTGEDPNQTNNNSNQVQKNNNNQQPPIPDRLPPLVPATNCGKNRQFHKNSSNPVGNFSRSKVVHPQGHTNMGNQYNNVSHSNSSQTFANNFLPPSAQQQSTPIKPKMETGYEFPKMENYENNFQKMEHGLPKIESISKNESFPKMEYNSLPKIDSLPPMNNGSPEGNPSILRHSSSSSFPDSGINGMTTQYFNPVQNVLNTSYHTPNNSHHVTNSSQNGMITPQKSVHTEIKPNKTGPSSSFDIDLGLLYNMNQNSNDQHMSKMNNTSTNMDRALDPKFDSNNGMPTLTPETGALVPWKPDETPAKNEEIDIFKNDLFKNDIFKSDIFKSDLFNDQLLKNEPLFKNDFKTDSYKNDYSGVPGVWSKNTNQFKNNNLKNNQFNSVDELLNSNFPNFNQGNSGQPNFNFSNNFFSFPPHPSTMDNIKNEFQAGSFGNYHPNQHGFPQVNVNIFNSTQTVPNVPKNTIPNVGLLEEATTSSAGHSTKQQAGQSNAQQNHHHHHQRQNLHQRNTQQSTQNDTSNNGRQQQSTNHHHLHPQNNPQPPQQQHQKQPFSSSAQTSNVNFQQVHVYQQFNFPHHPSYHQNFPETFSGQSGNSHQHHSLSGNPFNSSHSSNTFFHPFGLNTQMPKKSGDGVQGRKYTKKMKKVGQKVAKTKLPELQQNDGYYPYVKKYKCQELGCGKAFRRSDQLKRHHLCLHTNERPWICNFPNCNSKFGRSDHLQSHQKNRKHRDEDPIPPEYQRNLPVEQKKLM